MKRSLLILFTILTLKVSSQTFNPSAGSIDWNPNSGTGLANGTFNCGQSIVGRARINITGSPSSSYPICAIPMIITFTLTDGATFIGNTANDVVSAVAPGPLWEGYFSWTMNGPKTIITATQTATIALSISGLAATEFDFDVKVPIALGTFSFSTDLAMVNGQASPCNGTRPNSTATGVDDTESTVANLWCRSLPFESVAIQSLHLEAQGIGLTWKTFNESNTKIFEIERMIDVKNNTWLNVGTVPAAGTSIQELTYQYMDKTSTAAAKIYYRIKQIDQDGSFIYSDSRSIQPLRSKLALSIEGYPNPTRGTYNLSIESKTDETMQLEIFDILGKSILKQNIPVQAGSNLHPIAMDRLNTGTYLVKVSGKETSEVLTVMKVD